MPVEFVHDVSDAKDAYKLVMAYDGSGRRVSKTRLVKDDQRGYWYTDHVTHYTGIGTEVREVMRRSASPKPDVVVNMPQGLGRYGVEDASTSDIGFGAGYIPSAKFEWYLKNHLGSTMLVYGTQGSSNADVADLGEVKKAYDYRSFGEQIDLIADAGDKVTENFTGKERDDETELNYFGARYLDPMLGLWVSVDPKRQFASPYLYVGNGMNPINGVDPDGNAAYIQKNGNNINVIVPVTFMGPEANAENITTVINEVQNKFTGRFGQYNVSTQVVLSKDNSSYGVNNIVFLAKGVESKVISIPGQTQGALINVNSLRNKLHEFGHLLGFDDAYIRDPENTAKHDAGLKSNWGKPYDGYENNLMGGGMDVFPSQIEQMWKSGPTNPSNLYEYNIIDEE
ncbi:MAG: RHS repeat-associated core domain-containing protein [Fibrobacter sp.]|nr:RHS repeat-associated core domain-containing protein [Fibrobacter sp.]